MFFVGSEMQYDKKSLSHGQLVINSFIMTMCHSCITSHAEIFGETSNHPGDSAPDSPDLVPCDIWLFPELKSPLKGKRFQTLDEIQENMMGQLMAIGRIM